MNKETYTINIYCENCGHEDTKDIEKGRRCSGYFECLNCGVSDAKIEK